MLEAVLLHGVGLDKSIWSDVQNLLDSQSVALDLPGHGEQTPLIQDISVADLAEDIYRRLPQGKIHLVGFSLGALISAHLAATYPEKIKTLTLVGSVCDRTVEEQKAVAGRLEKARSNFQESMEIAIERWFPDNGEATEKLRQETLKILLKNQKDSYLRAYAAFATGDQQVSRLLTQIKAPTLIITGELDPGSTPEMSQKLGEQIPNSKVEIVSNARHMLPSTHAQLLAQYLNHHFTQG